MTETHHEKRLIGYARVSTVGQTLDSQLEQLRAAGCISRNIYREKVTGARPDRRELNRMLGKLAPGDVVTVTRIDRLARSTFDLFGIVKRIVDAKAQFRSLAEPWADIDTSTGRLMLAVLGGLADVERDLIRTRTAEGRSRAKAQGKHMGRPPSHTGPTERGDQTTRAGRYAARIGAQLQCEPSHHFQTVSSVKLKVAVGSVKFATHAVTAKTEGKAQNVETVNHRHRQPETRIRRFRAGANSS